MTAVEFIQKFGWEKARESMSHVAWCETAYCIRLGHGCFKSASDCCVDINDLKRYVDAWELVQFYDGLSQSKFWVSMMDGCDHVQSRVNELKKAITLVEEVVTK